MKLDSIVKNTLNGVKQNLPAILTGTAVLGIVSTTVSAVFAAHRTHDRVEDLRDFYAEQNQKVPYSEYVKVLWRDYLPTAVLATTTVVSMVGASTINHKRNMAAASLYALSEKTLENYKAKVEEEFGKNKATKVSDAVAQDLVSITPIGDVNVANILPNGSLFLDSLTGRYFTSTMEDVRSAVNTFNETLMSDYWCDVNDFLALLGLDDVMLGRDAGWNSNRLLKVTYSTTLTNDKQISAQIPCIVINYEKLPVANFRNY